ncbi:MAG TPA: hypothetical protein VK177_17225 [Flavobacteriales bacterium]|nr:hypothetical protein [Flavobacteriales bacterium]
MKIAAIIVILLVFAACGGTEKKSDDHGAVQQKDTTQQTDTVLSSGKDTIYPEEQKIELGSIPNLSFQDRLKLLKTKYQVNYAEIHPENVRVEVLDRFTCEKKFIFHLKKKMPVKYGKVENVFPVANFHAYVYADSAQCANALNNWYNCFGNDCSQVTPGVSTTIKTTPGFYIINQNTILCLDYALEHSENNWQVLINHMRKLFETSQTTFIVIKPHGKLTWEKSSF